MPTETKKSRPTGNPTFKSIVRRKHRSTLRLRAVVAGGFPSCAPFCHIEIPAPPPVPTRQQCRAAARESSRGLAPKPPRVKNRLKGPRAGRAQKQAAITKLVKEAFGL